MTGKSHRTIGYLRVSTGTQDLKKNRAEILTFANENEDLGRVEFVEETASGRTAWRDRKIATVLDGLGADDILIVSELSRIGRSMLDCMEILAIAAKREIRVYAIKGNWQLDETIQSKIMAMVFSMAAEIERGLISARTKDCQPFARDGLQSMSALSDGRKAPAKASWTSTVRKSRQKTARQRVHPEVHREALQKVFASANLANWLKKRGIKKPKLIQMKSCGGFGKISPLSR